MLDVNLKLISVHISFNKTFLKQSDGKKVQKMVEINQTLDCKGLPCPMPIVKLNGAIKKIEIGQVLEMLGTDPGSKGDVPLWCKRKGLCRILPYGRQQ